MAATALEIKKEGNTQYIFVVTEPLQPEEGILARWFITGSDFIPSGPPSVTTDKRSEEEYHKSLRREASLRQHFVPGNSTNPEWNE